MPAADSAGEVWQWTRDAFLRASEAGVFGDAHVEYLEGRVVRVVFDHWHGEVTVRLAECLPRVAGWTKTQATLASGESLPDPDWWVRRSTAEPIAHLAAGLAVWDPADVALVVEVADASYPPDTTDKMRIYGRAGYLTYWVVSRDGIEVFSEPHPTFGYSARHLHGPGEMISVPYGSGLEVSVSEILGL